jgi:hypothetical protein
MVHRTVVSALIALAAVLRSQEALAIEEPLYPVLDCYEQVSATEVRLHFAVTNLLTTQATPSLNVFGVGGIPYPTPAT